MGTSGSRSSVLDENRAVLAEIPEFLMDLMESNTRLGSNPVRRSKHSGRSRVAKKKRSQAPRPAAVRSWVEY